ncbi:MAG: glycosyltransferase family 39 protein [Aggregatilineales bacterium]
MGLSLALLLLAFPGAALLVRPCLRESRWLVIASGLGLGIGAITLILLWMGLLGIRFDAGWVVAAYLILTVPGLILWLREGVNRPAFRPKLPRSWPRRLALALLTAISASVLLNAILWPFHREDVLGIYQPQAQMLYQTRALIPLTGTDSLYRAYPMSIPLAYTFAYLITGWENEYLANLLAALLSVGCLLVAYLLGRMTAGERAGWAAALLLALAPIFPRWASSGYVDLPMAFFYGLSAVFALRLWETKRLIDALLAGVLMGLAAWTKNAALLGIPILTGWLLWAWLHRRSDGRHLAAALTACVLIAGPWYARNLLGAGFLIPATAWTDQAQPTLANLLVFLTRAENFALTGVIITGGLLYALIAVIDRRKRSAAELILLLWTLPFFGAWWLFVSYDPRFLLLFLPPLCALGGALLDALWARVPARAKILGRFALAVVALVLAVQAVWFSIEYKASAPHAPFMTDAERRAIVSRE